MKPKVEISRGTLAAMVTTVAASLLTVAFLLGRESTRPSAAASPAPVVAATLNQPPLAVSETQAATTLRAGEVRPLTSAPAAASPSPQPPESRAVVPTADSAATRAVTLPPRAVASAATAISANQASPEPVDREAVRAYFSKVDAIAVGSQTLDDPSGFANELLTQSLQGDNSGFDQLLGSAEQSLRELEAVVAPPLCREHHRLLVSQTRSGIALLRKVKGATSSMDTTTLTTLSAQGKAMQGETVRLQQLERQLRSI